MKNINGDKIFYPTVYYGEWFRDINILSEFKDVIIQTLKSFIS